jgi:hypothetical protein
MPQPHAPQIKKRLGSTGYSLDILRGQLKGLKNIVESIFGF